MCCILRCLEAPGGPDSNEAKGNWCCGWVRLKNLARARLWGLESLEAGSDECLEDPGSGRLHVSYSTVSGGS